MGCCQGNSNNAYRESSPSLKEKLLADMTTSKTSTSNAFVGSYMWVYNGTEEGDWRALFMKLRRNNSVEFKFAHGQTDYNDSVSSRPFEFKGKWRYVDDESVERIIVTAGDDNNSYDGARIGDSVRSDHDDILISYGGYNHNGHDDNSTDEDDFKNDAWKEWWCDLEFELNDLRTNIYCVNENEYGDIITGGHDGKWCRACHECKGFLSWEYIHRPFEISVCKCDDERTRRQKLQLMTRDEYDIDLDSNLNYTFRKSSDDSLFDMKPSNISTSNAFVGSYMWVYDGSKKGDWIALFMKLNRNNSVELKFAHGKSVHIDSISGGPSVFEGTWKYVEDESVERIIVTAGDNDGRDEWDNEVAAVHLEFELNGIRNIYCVNHSDYGIITGGYDRKWCQGCGECKGFLSWEYVHRPFGVSVCQCDDEETRQSKLQVIQRAHDDRDGRDESDNSFGSRSY